MLKRWKDPFSRFLRHENSSGYVLLLSLLIALICVNSPWSRMYESLLQVRFGSQLQGLSIEFNLEEVINDGLMVIFFFTVGLELKREFIDGELSSIRKSILPIAAALGGMIVPALIYLIFNKGTSAIIGWGIPMATDIAFAAGIMALLSKKIPQSVKVFLMALAIADDLGAVVIIAVFYTAHVSVFYLALTATGVLILGLLNVRGVRKAWIYITVGILAVWLPLLLSGVHATIAGILTAFTIPAKGNSQPAGDSGLSKRVSGNKNIQDAQIKSIVAPVESMLEYLLQLIHPWVAFAIVPIFVLANAGLELNKEMIQEFNNPVSLGIAVGLVAGKFIGIMLACWIVVITGTACLPSHSNWKHIAGVSLLAGIGFTMSLFVTNLAFDEHLVMMQAKAGIIAGSLIAALLALSYFMLIDKVENVKT